MREAAKDMAPAEQAAVEAKIKQVQKTNSAAGAHPTPPLMARVGANRRTDRTILTRAAVRSAAGNNPRQANPLSGSQKGSTQLCSKCGLPRKGHVCLATDAKPMRKRDRLKEGEAATETVTPPATTPKPAAELSSVANPHGNGNGNGKQPAAAAGRKRA